MTKKDPAKKFNRMAPFFDLIEKPIINRALPLELRKSLLSMAKGRVLEVGVGTGTSFPYYHSNMEITAIDFSSAMIEKAKEKVSSSPVPVDLRVMSVEALDFPEDTFNYVFSFCVFCSVPDPELGLKELHRVLKPGGKLIMVEHVRSEGPILGKVMDLVAPLVVTTIGDHINRRTLDLVRKQGFRIIEESSLGSEILKLIIAENKK